MIRPGRVGTSLLDHFTFLTYMAKCTGSITAFGKHSLEGCDEVRSKGGAREHFRPEPNHPPITLHPNFGEDRKLDSMINATKERSTTENERKLSYPVLLYHQIDMSIGIGQDDDQSCCVVGLKQLRFLKSQAASR
jgi:hypothetical protein